LLESYNIECNNDFGFAILINFNKNKIDNELRLENFHRLNISDQFIRKEDNKPNIKFILNCEDNLDYTEKIVLQVLEEVFKYKSMDEYSVFIQFS